VKVSIFRECRRRSVLLCHFSGC